MKKLVLLMFITVFALTGVAAAKGPTHRGPGTSIEGNNPKGSPDIFWKRERVAQALSLTEEEKEKLSVLHQNNRETVQVLRNEMREERQALRKVMVSDDFSAASAKKHFKRAEEVRSEISGQRFEFQLQQRELLGQERYIKLQKMEKRAMEKRQENR